MNSVVPRNARAPVRPILASALAERYYCSWIFGVVIQTDGDFRVAASKHADLRLRRVTACHPTLIFEFPAILNY
jgi:hypothetical protein